MLEAKNRVIVVTNIPPNGIFSSASQNREFSKRTIPGIPDLGWSISGILNLGWPTSGIPDMGWPISGIFDFGAGPLKKLLRKCSFFCMYSTPMRQLLASNSSHSDVMNILQKIGLKHSLLREIAS